MPTNIYNGKGVFLGEWFKPGTSVPWRPPVSEPYTVNNVRGNTFDRPAKAVINRVDSTGWRSPSPWNLTASDYLMWSGTFSMWGDVNSTYHSTSRWTGDMPSSVRRFDTSIPSVTASMVNRAETEALNKLKDMNVNYSVALAESRKSLSLIGGNLLSLYNAYKAAKRGDWKTVQKELKIPRHTFKKRSKDTSGRWLELQYGWLPLLSDIAGAYEDARRGLIRSEQRISVVRVVKERCPLPAVMNFFTQTNWIAANPNVVVRYKHSAGSVYGAKVRLDYVIHNPDLSNAARLGLLNPVEVAWELVPFSFVVDWIIPVGNFISAFDADFGLTFKAGSLTKFVRVKRTATVETPKLLRKANSVVRDVSVIGSFNHISMVRSVYSAPPKPSLYWKNPVSAAHAANALALLTQILTRK